MKDWLDMALNWTSNGRLTSSSRVHFIYFLSRIKSYNHKHYFQLTPQLCTSFIMKE